jgi:transcriptional regulator GlxA family with amidase domain
MDRRIEAAIEIMRREPSRNLPVGEIATKIRLSHWRFIHLFKAETLYSEPHRYGEWDNDCSSYMMGAHPT